MFNFCKKNISNVAFQYATNNDYEVEHTLLRDRHAKAITIIGTQKLHQFIPESASTLKVKRYSSSENVQLRKVCNSDQFLAENQIHGYVTAIYDNLWWLGYVHDKYTENREVTINFLHPHGPSHSFCFPIQQDILRVPYCDILAKADVTTCNGRTYMMAGHDQRNTTAALEKTLKLTGTNNCFSS